MKLSRHWLWLLLLVPVLMGLARLRFDVEVLNLLPQDSALVRGLKTYQENFSNGREMLITLKSRSPDQTEAAAQIIVDHLRIKTNLVARATWQPPWQENPALSAELIGYLWLNQPPETFSHLTNRLSGENLTNTLVEAREQLASSLSPGDIATRAYDPLELTKLPASSADSSALDSGSEFFSSADGTFRLVFVQPATDLSNYRHSESWVASIKQLVTEARNASPELKDVTIGYTGGPVFIAEIAGGMERDMAGPSLGTLAVIALLFYYTHRRLLPLLWLVTLLIVILGATLALGGLIFGTLSVISLGFASILLGLAEDFGIVLYQEFRSHPELSLQRIRRIAAPGILWSMVTTSGAFFLLNLSGLPGLGQLGSLVGIGIIIAALVLLFGFLPPLFHFRKRESVVKEVERPRTSEAVSPGQIKVRWAFTFLLIGAGLILLWQSPPHFDPSPDALRPQKSGAYDAMAEIKENLGPKRTPLWLLLHGKDEAIIATNLVAAEKTLDLAVSNGLVSSFTLPTELWPQRHFQLENRTAAKSLLEQKEKIYNATFTQGFTSNSLGLTENIFATWAKALASTNTFWPTNDSSRWIFEKISATNGNGIFALGLVHPAAETVHGDRRLVALNAALPPDSSLSGWELLGTFISDIVFHELPKVLVPIFVLVVVTLWLAFRNWKDVLLSLATVAFSGICLLIVMSAAGWSWNLMNLMAIPLLLGMGVDFSIHMQLALHRHAGEGLAGSGSIGRALLLAGSTTAAGFASLAFSTNAGLASMGKICAVGIACSMLVAVFLLPAWWNFFVNKKRIAK